MEFNIGEKVRISGEVYYGDRWIRVASDGIIEHAGTDACLVNVDMIDGDWHANVIVKNRYIHSRKEAS